MSGSAVLALYRGATAVLAPFAGAWLGARARAGKEDPARLAERYGRARAPRPEGRLVWLHAASVGEFGVARLLIEALAAGEPSLAFLVSTGTRTSADLFAQRPPARTTHVYAPLDRPDAARRFIAHWRPDLGVFIESELWPNLILEAEAARVPLALVNARMSPKSLARWRDWPGAGRRLMGAFELVLCADTRTADALSQLRASPAAHVGNLKLAASAPALDASARTALLASIGARKVWLAASTHEGEDEIVLNAHERLRAEFPDALLVIAPRHPERGAAVAALAGGAPRRSEGAPIGAGPVYVADTMGELALFYAAAPCALIAGSLLPHLKGHNPLEAARLDCAVISGPYVESFADLYEEIFAAGGAAQAPDAEAIAAAVRSAWSGASEDAAWKEALHAMFARGEAALDETGARLMSLLPAPARTPMSADAPA